MEKVNNKGKISLYVIIFLEIVFLIRAYVIYSFYKNDDTYGDGISNASKYEHDLYSTVFISLVVASFLMLGLYFIFKNRDEQ